MRVKVYVESAFCKDNSGGNRAGIVLFNDKLNEIQKKEISAKLGYAETAFVTKSDKADFKIEYFTPSEEVPLCGHATVATFALMLEQGMLDRKAYTFETRAGVLSIGIEGTMVVMEQTKPQYFEILGKMEIADCFDVEEVSGLYPIQIVSTGLRDIIVPIKSESALAGLRPEFNKISEISSKYDTIGMHAFVLDGERIVCRNFAPLYDVPEESATGTANCALASYLYNQGILRKKEYYIEQGYSLNSPSEIIVRINEENGEINRVFVSGRGRFVEATEVDIAD